MDEHKTTSRIEELLKFGSFLYILLVAAGLAFNYYYYKQFGINITGYIDFTEALILFLPFMVKVLLVPLIYFLLWNNLINRFAFHASDDDTGPKLFGSKDGMRKVIKVLSWVFLAITIIVFSISLFKPEWNVTFYLILVFDICFFGPFWLELLFEGISYSLTTVYKYAIYTIIITISFVIYSASSKAERFRNKRDFQYFELINSDPSLSIRNDSTLQLLGRTKNYIFIYDFKTKSTSVYDINNVKRFTMWEQGANNSNLKLIVKDILRKSDTRAIRKQKIDSGRSNKLMIDTLSNNSKDNFINTK